MTFEIKNIGSLGKCPICQFVLNTPSRSATAPIVCQRCEKQLWFLVTPEGTYYFDQRSVSKPVHEIAAVIAPLIKMDLHLVVLSLSWIDEIIEDSLDYVEIIINLDRSFSSEISGYYSNLLPNPQQIDELNRKSSDFADINKLLGKSFLCNFGRQYSLSKVIKYIVEDKLYFP